MLWVGFLFLSEVVSIFDICAGIFNTVYQKSTQQRL